MQKSRGTAFVAGCSLKQHHLRKPVFHYCGRQTSAIFRHHFNADDVRTAHRRWRRDDADIRTDIDRRSATIQIIDRE
jgi:hypothetical protein